MKHLLIVVAAVLVLTGCNAPFMLGGGWSWDPSPSHPITVDNRIGVDMAGAAAAVNAAAGTTVFAAYPPGDPGGASAARRVRAMNILESLRERADPNCPECGGSGLIEGIDWPVLNMWGEQIAHHRDNDRACTCVPEIVIEVKGP